VSRNLGRCRCYFCGTEPTLDEQPRPITAEDAGYYFAEYEGMLVANATCSLCRAKYIAWVDMRTCANTAYYGGYRLDLYARYGDAFFDLSFRNSFNDEPSVEDLPLFKVEPRRVGPFIGSAAEHYRRNDPDEWAKHEARALAAWEAL
jgi:hypothetical protein